MTFYNRDLKPCSRSLRNNMTEAEWRLWYVLKNKQLNGHQFYRQKIIGDYIVDFYCPAVKLVVEVDGSQHQSKVNAESDKKRDEFLKNHGLNILRVNNLEVLRNIEGVVHRILEYLEIPLNPPYT
jgi:very-short-patch-repair endonuclease